MTPEEIVYKYLADNNLLQDASIYMDLLPTPEDLLAAQTSKSKPYTHSFMRYFIKTEYLGTLIDNRYLQITEEEYVPLKEAAQNWKLLNP